MHRYFRLLLFIDPSDFRGVISYMGSSNSATRHENERNLESKKTYVNELQTSQIKKTLQIFM